MNKNHFSHKFQLILVFFIFLALALGLLYSTHAKANPAVNSAPISQISDIPAEVASKMKQSTWSKGCPVPIEELAYLKLPYWGYDDKPHQGILIVNKVIAQETTEIFAQLYKDRFPIYQMRPIYQFGGDDEKSMEANNTSAFNCRKITGGKALSNHSYGFAIDINPLVNPYVKNDIILPPQGKAYLTHEKDGKGKITPESDIYHLFISKGWAWGGNWYSVKDYQHFEKVQRV